MESGTVNLYNYKINVDLRQPTSLNSGSPISIASEVTCMEIRCSKLHRNCW